MADLITINVDGRDVQVPAKIQLIEALRGPAQTDTPAFCYHQDLQVAGHERAHHPIFGVIEQSVSAA